jgi:hypothetical protein
MHGDLPKTNRELHESTRLTPVECKSFLPARQSFHVLPARGAPSLAARRRSRRAVARGAPIAAPAEYADRVTIRVTESTSKRHNGWTLEESP